MEHYEKNKQFHQNKEMPEEFSFAQQPKEQILLDLNPQKFEKRKDNLFFNFFSLYTKQVIKQQSKEFSNESLQIKESKLWINLLAPQNKL